MAPIDTIVAAATPPGRGGIGIVRLSGPAAPRIAAALTGLESTALEGASLPPRTAVRARFLDDGGTAIDSGLMLRFPAPRSYTGEEVVELHGHGGPVIMEALVARAVALGARHALPGEFTQRAFLNGKLDLVEAEAVADLIDAGSREAARAALRSLDGEFSAILRSLTEELVELRVHVEAAIDFPEEEIDFLSDPAIARRLASIRERFAAVQRSAGQGRLLRDGMTVVIAGRPNAGKSSLLNRLAGYDAAIVTAVPGTTRDVLRERIDIDGMPLHILDTAGLRKPGDVIEEEGIRRAQTQMQRADRILFVVDAAVDPDGAAYLEERALLPPEVPVTLVFNKCDLVGAAVPDSQAASLQTTDGRATGDRGPRAATVGRPIGARATSARPTGAASVGILGDRACLSLSALTGEGIDGLRAHLKGCMGYQTLESGTVGARSRHLEALGRARAHTDTAARELEERRAGELIAEELRAAQRALGEITGEVTSDDLLGRIFASFCVGK